MPGRVVVIGVEAADMTQGRLELTPVVAAAVDVVVARVRKLVADRHNAFHHEVGHA
jgi:Ni,Fe-hydrogenase maturation factor